MSFVGSVIASALSNIPDGYLLCDGASLSTSQYPDLFQAIGYTFGGSGSSFNLPDLREKFVRGVGSTHVLGTSESDGNKTHSHSVSLSGNSGSSGSHSHLVPMASGSSNSQTCVKSFIDTFSTNTIVSSSDGSHSHSVSLSGNSGSSGDSETRPKNLALKYLIRYLPFEISSGGVALTEEQADQLKIVSDFVKSNCKDNGDGTYDYSKMFPFVTGSGDTFHLSEDLKIFLTGSYWKLPAGS